MNKRNETLYIADILTSIKNIESYTQRVSFKEFLNNQMIIDAVIRNLEIIGEAAKNLSSETRSSRPDIPWEDIIGMRNKIAHEYFGVDIEIIWETIRESLPELKKMMKKIKRN